MIVRGLIVAVLAAVVAGLVAFARYDVHAAEQAILILAPVGVATVLAVGAAATRVERLEPQLLLAGIATALGAAGVVALFVDRMFVSGHDALFTLLVAGYALTVGGWAAWTIGRSALARLEAAERARRDLVAAVSHDLRTPITALQVLAEAVDDEVVDPATRTEYVRRMTTHVRALGALIDDLFELSRLEAGDVRWSIERVHVQELVTETVEAMRPQAEAGGVVVRAELPPALAPARGNPEQLQRVLFNLIQNAIRHTPADGSVVVRAESIDGRLELEVADTGDGIAASDRARVFEAFVQSDDRAARTDGAGLGLAIARAIVEAHGGRIWLADAEAGTRVRFSVPAAP